MEKMANDPTTDLGIDLLDSFDRLEEIVEEFREAGEEEESPQANSFPSVQPVRSNCQLL